MSAAAEVFPDAKQQCLGSSCPYNIQVQTLRMQIDHTIDAHRNCGTLAFDLQQEIKDIREQHSHCGDMAGEITRLHHELKEARLAHEGCDTLEDKIRTLESKLEHEKEAHANCYLMRKEITSLKERLQQAQEDHKYCGGLAYEVKRLNQDIERFRNANIQPEEQSRLEVFQQAATAEQERLQTLLDTTTASLEQAVLDNKALTVEQAKLTQDHKFFVQVSNQKQEGLEASLANEQENNNNLKSQFASEKQELQAQLQAARAQVEELEVFKAIKEEEDRERERQRVDDEHRFLNNELTPQEQVIKLTNELDQIKFEKQKVETEHFHKLQRIEELLAENDLNLNNRRSFTSVVSPPQSTVSSSSATLSSPLTLKVTRSQKVTPIPVAKPAQKKEFKKKTPIPHTASYKDLYEQALEEIDRKEALIGELRTKFRLLVRKCRFTGIDAKQAMEENRKKCAIEVDTLAFRLKTAEEHLVHVQAENVRLQLNKRRAGGSSSAKKNRFAAGSSLFNTPDSVDSKGSDVKSVEGLAKSFPKLTATPPSEPEQTPKVSQTAKTKSSSSAVSSSKAKSDTAETRGSVIHYHHDN